MKIKGFTIVEILVVIGIIGVLTVIIFPSINNIRAKNRDAERVADISAIQLGLSLYKNQNSEYPKEIYDNIDFSPKYVTADSLVGPDGKRYTYVPLKRGGDKCTYYHLGAVLELPSGQIDTADTFSSKEGSISDNYSYCGNYSGPGIVPPNITDKSYSYNVHP